MFASLKKRWKFPMLDLSDRHVPRVPAERQEASAETPPTSLPVVGSLYRHFQGRLYRIEALAQSHDSAEPVVLYRPVDPSEGCSLLSQVLSEFTGNIKGGSLPRFSALRSPADDALRYYLPDSVMADKTLEAVLSRYDEPWRHFHGRWHVLDMFDKARQLGLSLSLEQSLAVLFHDAVYVPGAAEGVNESQSSLLMLAFKGQVCAEIDWTVVSRIINDTGAQLASTEHSAPVLDLDLASLAEDPVHFCAADELVWLENRHLLSVDQPRKDFDTRRLRYLLSLADRGPLFSTMPASWEEAARNNLEGLRQAWVRKYGGKDGA